MLKRLKLLVLALFFLITLGFSSSALVMATCDNPGSPAEAIQCGTNNAAGVPNGASPTKTINNTLRYSINLISVAVGIAAVVMIIVGGFRYVTSGGNQEKVKSAKNTLIYAIIGLVVVALAQVIVNFVLSNTQSCINGVTPSGQKC